MPDPIELRHLKNLTMVAEEGNITEAAVRLFISQSLSQQIKKLEKSAQACLLVRHHAGVYATPAAEILIAGNNRSSSSMTTCSLLHTLPMPRRFYPCA